MNVIFKQYARVVYGSIAIFIFGLVPCPATGQVLAKKPLLPEDYKLWGTLQPLGISDNGKWINYSMGYDDGSDTLFLRHTDTRKTYHFPKGSSGKFGGSSDFGYIDSGGQLEVIHLDKDKSDFYPDVSKFDFSTGGKFLVVLQTLTNGSRQLQIRENNRLAGTIHGINEYTWNSAKDAILFSKTAEGKSTVGIISLFGVYAEVEIVSGKLPYFKLSWANNGNGVVFYCIEDKLANSQLFYYRLRDRKLFAFSSSDVAMFPDDMIIDSSYGLPVTVSDDGRKVFFGVKNKSLEKSQDTTNVEIWNGSDQWLYPTKKAINGWKDYPKLAVWWPDTGKFRQISTEAQNWVMLTGNTNYAVLADTGAYQPQYTLNGDVDYSLMNIENGDSELLVKRVSGETMNTAISSDGKYVGYYLDGNWWVYDIGIKRHRNMTGYLNTSWDASDFDSGNSPSVYGVAGWSEDGTTMLVYDAFDIWAFSMLTGKGNRLTNGREQNIRFRLYSTALNLQGGNYSGRGAVTFNISGSVILEAFDYNNFDAGYYVWNKTSGAKKLAFRNSCADRLTLSGDKKTFMFVEQNYELPPRIVVSDWVNEKPIFESNPQHKQFLFGGAKMMTYMNSKGQKLNAALFYPANFEASKKYPMVVNIYENISRNIHYYVNPSTANHTGFNISNFTSEGYLVLLPDIVYEKDGPGVSAVDCVSSAVKMIIDKGNADPSRIGLIGHSFGGYETNFIITQTDLFAAAVSSSGIADVVTSYFTLGKMTGLPDMWRYETQQFRMGQTFYDDKAAYFRNSPILFADNITTPLLLWAGKDDDNVNHDQTMAFYLALRRLGKANIMLLYPRMGHIAIKPGQQRDVTLRVEDWFDYYLKGKDPAAWICDGLSGHGK